MTPNVCVAMLDAGPTLGGLDQAGEAFVLLPTSASAHRIERNENKIILQLNVQEGT